MALAPPLTPAQYLGIVSATYAKFGPKYSAPEAQLMCVATALQETRLQTRVQTNGPARGFTQTQENSIADVKNNPASKVLFCKWCDILGIPYDPTRIYGRLTSRDDVDAAMFRLRLWCEPKPIPAIGDMTGAWLAYCDVQRPGKPDLSRWEQVYPQALATLQAAS